MKVLKFLIIFIAGFLVSCSGNDNNIIKDSSKEFEKICIEGHVYFKREDGHKGYLSIKLSDDGKPIKCGE